MKYVLMIHSNPQPWGHPTADYLAVYQDVPQEVRDRLDASFEETLAELQERGELLGGEALGDPSTATLYRWAEGAPVPVSGPYSESQEHLAGFFLLDVPSRERAEEVAARFSGPGETVELRPMMGSAGDDPA